MPSPRYPKLVNPPGLPSEKSVAEIAERIALTGRAPGLVHHSGLTTHSIFAEMSDLDLLGSRQTLNDSIYVHFLVTVRLYLHIMYSVG